MKTLWQIICEHLGSLWHYIRDTFHCHLLCNNLQTLSCGLSVPSGYGSCHSAVSHPPAQPLIGTPATVEWLQDLANASNDMSRINSPSPCVDANYQLSDSPVPTITNLEFGQMTTLQNVPNLTPGTSINIVCKHHAVTDDMMGYAKFLTMEKLLLAMVKNYKWMLHILRCLGLQDNNMLFTPSWTITFSGGLTLSAGNVVKHFG